MKAALCRQFGGPEVIEIDDLPDPEPGAGEVVVDVGAVSLNFFDTLIIRNKYQYKPEFPFSPGAEIAGTVSALGEGVSGVEPGQRVMAYIGWNGAREKAVVPAAALAPIPDSVSDAVASGLSVTFGTAMHGLADRGRLAPGETVAVLGASGGAGLAAVQIAKRMGARVIAAASSPEKLEIARANGADEIIDYAKEDLKERLKALSGGAGADVIYDCVGGPYSEPALRATAWGGRFLVVGFAAGDIPKVPLNLILLKGCDMVGVFWGSFTERHPDRNAANIAQVMDWCAKGELAPHIHGEFSLAETRAALEVIDRREAKGKVVVCP